MIKVIGLVLIVAGAGLLVWGYQLSGSLSAQLTETVSGAMPDEVMARYIAGAASLIVGVYLLFTR
jgi:drug/metabolite transporter (DMT)-like permease